MNTPSTISSSSRDVTCFIFFLHDKHIMIHPPAWVFHIRSTSLTSRVARFILSHSVKHWRIVAQNVAIFTGYSGLTQCAGMSVFSPVTVDELHTAIRRLSDKQCDTDLLPTWLFKLCADQLAPFLCRLFNRSFSRPVEGIWHASRSRRHSTTLGGVHHSQD